MDINTKVYETIETYLAAPAAQIEARNRELSKVSELADVREQYRDIKKLYDKAKGVAKDAIGESKKKLEALIEKQSSTKVGKTKIDCPMIAQRKNGQTTLVLSLGTDQPKDSIQEKYLTALKKELGEPQEIKSFGSEFSMFVYKTRSIKKLEKAAKRVNRALRNYKIECRVEVIDIDLAKSIESYKPEKEVGKVPEKVVDFIVSQGKLTPPKFRGGETIETKVTDEKPAEQSKRQYTVAEAAEMTGYCLSSIKNHIRDENLQARKVKVGGIIQYMISHSDLVKFARKAGKDIEQPSEASIDDVIVKALAKKTPVPAIIQVCKKQGYDVTKDYITSVKKKLNAGSYRNNAGKNQDKKPSKKPKKKPLTERFSKTKLRKIVADLERYQKTGKKKKDWKAIKKRHDIDGMTLQGIRTSYVNQGKGKSNLK